MSVYTFLDNIIWKAYKVPHLPYEELPPIADYDRAKHLVARAFPVSNLLVPFFLALLKNDRPWILSKRTRDVTSSGTS